ncbi:MAG: transposase [Gemmatimonadota bacterium]
MSLPGFSTQSELFSTAGLSAQLFGPTDRYRLFGKLVYPELAAARPALEKCYGADNGRTAIEPVLMLGVSILQELDGVPDRHAVELLHYHAGWNFALNRQLGDPGFHPTSLVNFRHRLHEHQQGALAFRTILDALEKAGLVSRQCRQRLDSTQMFGRVAKMSRLDCVRETLRLALQELEGATPAEERPLFWIGLWERYVESQVDYRASAETLGRKLGEAGADAWQLLQWLAEGAPAQRAAGPQAQLLQRVFGEQFEVRTGQAAPLEQEKEVVVAADTGEATQGQELGADRSGGECPNASATAAAVDASAQAGPSSQTEFAAEGMQSAAQIEPKGKGQLSSGRVQNPHDPEATYAVKGQGQQKKEHVGYKVQVAESVSEAVLAPGEPTRNFLVGIVTHAAHESDELGAVKMEQEQAQMGWEKPPVQYVEGAYVSAQKLVQAHAEGRELMGPAPPAPRKDGRFSAEDLKINVEERTAVCPAGKTDTQCSRLEEAASGKVSYRFEFSTHCHACPLRGQCLGQEQRHRTRVVGEHHSALQARRQEQRTEAFQQRMKHRHGIAGTQSELVRGHGLRRARYRGLAKVKLQNHFIGAACNVKRWIRREAWKLAQGVSVGAAEVGDAATA